MTELRGDFPDYIDVMAFLEKVKGNKKVTYHHLGYSDEKREIPCIVITDSSISSEQKARAMVITSQHGSEESGRAISLGLIEFLLSDDPFAQKLIKTQEIAIVPCCNPDGSQLNTYKNAKNVDIAHVHEFDKDPESPDALAVWKFAKTFQPELFIDIHGLAGGSMSDKVWVDAQHNFSVNSFFMTIMNNEAVKASETLGYPTCEPKVAGVLTNTSSSKRLGEKLSYLMNTMSFGVEAIEKYYTIKEWVPAGLARVKTLLSYGSEDKFSLHLNGYPNNLISGNTVCGLITAGKTAREKRVNRIAVTDFLRQNMVMAARDADGVTKSAKVEIFTASLNGVAPQNYSIMLRVKEPTTIKGITYNQKAISKQDYQIIEEKFSKKIIIQINEPIGLVKSYLVVEYDSPFLK